MRVLLLLLLLLLVSCGDKKPAPPLKPSPQRSELQLSPAGIAQVQRVFNLYSPTGKLSLREIRNISNRLSPRLGEYIDGLELGVDESERYTASDFFLLLGESNRTLLWGVAHNLHTTAGWNEVLAQEFADADPGLKAEAQRRIGEVLDVLTTVGGQENFAKLALKSGALFNLLDSTDPTPGSVFDVILKRLVLSASAAPGPEELAYASLRLGKFNLALRYVLTERAASPSAPAPDRFATWTLGQLRESLQTRYPGVTPESLENLLGQVTQELGLKLASADGSFHRILHPTAYAALGPSASQVSEDWSAYDTYELVRATCADASLPARFPDWVRFFDDVVVKLDYTKSEFCEALKGSFRQSPAGAGGQPGGRRSAPGSRAHSHRSVN